MSKRCDICIRGSQKGATRSHSNIKTNKQQKINLQSRKIEGGKIKICIKCIKTLNK
ncbi:50S ribosomal protein L28 [Patescibacteria group bacterium]|nr:50S ribosomal protein L28 [Patescibacteria group bacterium]